MPVPTLAIPAAAAGLAYLNARHGIAYDWPLLSSFFRGTISSAFQERSDTLNLFYELESHAQSSRAHHVWIIFQGQSWTYAQAYEIVLKYATWFKSKGVEKNDIVAMDFVNSATFIWVWFGLWSVGAKPAFINYNLTGKPLVHTIKTSTARLVLVDQEGWDNFGEESMREHGLVRADAPRADQMRYGYEMDQSEVPKSIRKHTATPRAAVEAGAVSEPLPIQRRLEVVLLGDALASHILTLPPTRLPNSARSDQKRTDIAMLIYTSGTTGLPKPAIMPWGKATAGGKGISLWLGLENEIVYTSMPLYHSSASILGVCAVLRAGGTICLSKKFSHKTFWPEIRASNATLIHYVGETCRYLLSAPPSALDKQHKVHGAFGNGLRPDVWEPFKKRFGIRTINEFYAATEAPGGLFNRSSNAFSSGAIGRTGTISTLLLGLTIVRLDPEADSAQPIRSTSTGLCELCAWNEPGELLYKLDPANIKGKFQGYFGNDSATQSKIIRNVRKQGDAYFRSGDLVRQDKEGRWWFVDRIGDTFRWKAENVSTAEVSEAVGTHEAVEEANIYGVQVPGHDGRAGCAAIVLKPAFAGTPIASKAGLALPSEQTLHSLAQHVKKELPAFAVPIWIRVTQQMQTTGTNKQQKHLLQADGIDPVAVEREGDVLFWFKDGTYERFTSKDLKRIEGGGVKL